MNQKLINVLMFTTGAAIGSLVTWRVAKSYYERYAQEEIDKFAEDWKSRVQHANIHDEGDWNDFEEEDEDEDDSNETEIYDYRRLASNYGTPSSDDKNDEEGEGGPGFPYVNGPVVITPDEFGDGNFAHSLYYLTYYADGVLANDWCEELDVEETIGTDAIEHFGDYAEGTVHVRNEQNAADYEVVRDPRTFAEVMANDPLMAAYAT